MGPRGSAASVHQGVAFSSATSAHRSRKGTMTSANLSPRRDPVMTPSAEIEALIKKLEEGEASLTDAKTSMPIVCTGEDAVRILKAGDGPHKWLVWSGTTTDRLRLGSFEATSIRLRGSVHGDKREWD